MKVMHHEKGRDALYKIWNASDEHMIIYFCSDGGSLVFPSAVYPIEKGGICFVRAGTVHYTVPNEPSVYNRSKIFLSIKRTAALLSSVSPNDGFHTLFTENSAVYAKIPEKERGTVEKLFSDAEGCFARGGEAGIAASFFYLLTLLYEHGAHHTGTPDSFMAKTVTYINEHYAEEIPLSSLCRVAGMSKSHFCRKFKSVMGITVMEYVLKTRIAAAKSLLLSSNLSISQISERCGFSSISYFCQKFKDELGESANAFRTREKSTKKP